MIHAIIPKWAKYVARDADGRLYAYEFKPYKHDRTWCQSGNRIAKVDVDAVGIFPSVKWEDEQPLYLGVKNEEVTSENVEHPKHYNIGGIETIDIIKTMLTKEEYIGYLKGNILKYRERAQFKGKPDEDYAKAREYMKMLESVAKVPIWSNMQVLNPFKGNVSLDRDPSALR